MTVGTNSWVTIVEADSYLAEKYGADAWSTFTDVKKKQLLVTAFWRIYNSKNFNIQLSSTDAKVKAAQIELAFWLSQYNTEWEKRQALINSGVVSFRVSKFSENYGKSISTIPEFINDILKDNYIAGVKFPTFNRELE